MGDTKPVNLEPKVVLQDFIQRLKRDAMEASQRGIREAASLAIEAEGLIAPIMDLPHDDMLEALDSVAAGLNYGLAKITEQNAKRFFGSSISAMLQFVSSLLMPLSKIDLSDL